MTALVVRAEIRPEISASEILRLVVCTFTSPRTPVTFSSALRPSISRLPVRSRMSTSPLVSRFRSPTNPRISIPLGVPSSVKLPSMPSTTRSPRLLVTWRFAALGIRTRVAPSPDDGVISIAPVSGFTDISGGRCRGPRTMVAISTSTSATSASCTISRRPRLSEITISMASRARGACVAVPGGVASAGGRGRGDASALPSSGRASGGFAGSSQARTWGIMSKLATTAVRTSSRVRGAACRSGKVILHEWVRFLG